VLFFCGQGQSRLASQAKAICAVCKVEGECLEFSLRYPEETEYGVWGGTTPGQAPAARALDNTRSACHDS
jgi:hypothetical protein